MTLAAAVAGCGEDIAHYRVPKDSRPSVGATQPPTGPVMASAEVAPPPSPSGGALAWSLPNGWSETRGGGMRFATLKPPMAGKLDVSVTVLAGEAGGELANVNRWRNQIGLGPLDAAALAAARKPLRAKVGPVSLYDFTSEGATRSRVVAGFTVVAGNTWFVKMTGDERPVADARPDFVRIVESLRLE